ncbi:MAG: hypothetical protein GF355_06595, partial [Candidatus Eisenbacteria bacterium]|nr:hypothetical protein [Candidatus Eisenbacteria bacterium]
EHWVQIGGIQLIGNRWLDQPIVDAQGDVVPEEELEANEEDFFPGVLNNKENADVYEPPYEVRTRSGIPEREQSLTLEMRNMPAGHTGRVYRDYARAQDFISNYETLEFYVKRRIDPPDAEVEFFLRLARDVTSDTTNYYEYRMPVVDEWTLIQLDLADLSSLKLDRDSTETVVRELPGGARLTVKGQPALTQVGRISLGAAVAGETEVAQGNVWIDELRLAGVRRDVGVAGRVSISSTLSDLADVSFNYERTGADFQPIIGRRSTGASPVTRTNLNFNTRVNMDRFISWAGFALPVTFNFQRNKDVPKYRSNSDIELQGRESPRDVSQRTSRTLQLRFSRRRSENPLLRYTLDAFSGGYSYSWSGNSQPTQQDTTWSSKYNLSFSPPMSGRGFRVYKDMRVNPLPTSFSLSTNYSRTERVQYQRINGDLDNEYERRQLTQPVVKQAGLSSTIGFNPFGPISYSSTSSRDLLAEDQDRLAGLKLGRETSRREQLSASVPIKFLSFLLGPRITPSISFTGQSNLDLYREGQAGDSLSRRVNHLRNSRVVSLSARVPLAELFSHWASVAETSDDEGQEEDGEGGEEEEGQKGDDRQQPRNRSRMNQRRPPSALSKLFSMGPITANYSQNRGSNYRYAEDMPSLPYRLGITEDPGDAVRRSEDLVSSESRDLTLSLKTDITLFQEVRIGTSFQRRENRTLQTGGATQRVDTTWPDLDIRWGQLYKKIGLQKYLGPSLQASTKYSRRESRSTTGVQGAERVDLTVDWSPLLRLSTTLSNGIKLEFTSTRRDTESQRIGASRSTSLNQNRRYALDLSKSIRLTRQIKLPLGGTQTISSRLDLALGIEYDLDRSEDGGILRRDVATTEGSISASYEFTRNIQGHGRIGVGERSDRKNRINTERHVSVSLSASFTF